MLSMNENGKVESMDPGMAVERARKLHLRARATRSAGHFESAYEDVSEAIQLLERSVQDEAAPRKLLSQELADLFATQGGILRRLGREEAAIRSYEAGRVYANFASLGAYNHVQIAVGLWFAGDHAKGDPELRSKLNLAIRKTEASILNDRSVDSWGWSDLGVLYLLNGQYDKSETAFIRYLESDPAAPVNLSVLNILARVWAKAIESEPDLSSVTKGLFVRLGGDGETLTPRDKFYSCFISYSSVDTEFAARLHDDLQRAGVRSWFAPHDMRIGDPVLSTVEGAIRSTNKLVLILSGSSIDSDWVEHEVSQALQREAEGEALVLFPLRIDDAILQTEFGWAKRIREAHKPTGRHIGNFSEWKAPDAYQKALTRLLRDLKDPEVPR
jgi:tetratricopeptide (TPR) repeat protein